MTGNEETILPPQTTAEPYLQPSCTLSFGEPAILPPSKPSDIDLAVEKGRLLGVEQARRIVAEMLSALGDSEPEVSQALKRAVGKIARLAKSE